VAAIEVYPAATLVAHRMRSNGYKKRDQTKERREIDEALRTKLTIGESVPDLAQSGDLVDAAVCVLAGADFISVRAMGPENRTLAEREGWIWTAAPMR
jgi:predicted RNase H-like nuclease